MHNLNFWNNALALVDRMACIEKGIGEIGLGDALQTFVESYEGNYEPCDHFQEYVLLQLVNRFNTILAMQ